MLNVVLQTIAQWAINYGIKILAILIVVWVVLRILKEVVHRVIKSVISKVHKGDRVDKKKRLTTLESILYSTVKIVVWVIAIMMIVSEFGINIGPILAAVGIAGLAFGFGAQYLIRDLIAGLFIILENQYRKGDVVTIAGISGLVEEISLRKTVLRDLDGIEHHIPNGEIKKTSNRTKYWSRINLDVGVSYDTDIDKAIKVLNEVGEKMAKDKNWKDIIIEAPQSLGVDEFGESAIIIKVLGQTKPGEHWNAVRELRKRIKKAFDREKIEIPFPHRVVIQK